MIEADLMNYISLIGNIKKEIDRAATLDEAIKNGLRSIADVTDPQYLIFWRAESDKKTLLPDYWIGPGDLTGSARKAENSIVGKVFESGESINLSDYKPGDDPLTEQDLKDVQISSMFCVPFDIDERIGCIQLIYSGNANKDKEVDEICRIMIMLISMTIKDKGLFNKAWPFNEVLLSLKDIRKSFKNGEEVTTVLKGVNLNVFKGEFLVLLGESGCGKSTLLNIIGGMNLPDSGTYKFKDMELQHASKKELTRFRKDNVGFVFQSYNLMPNLTALQNIQFIGELVKEPADPAELLEKVGMAEKGNNYPSQLSGGQQQRISIARALVKRPPLILADEPTAALDYATSIEVLDLFSKVVGNGTTLIMVTHNEEITRMADRVVRFRDGKVYEVKINSNPVSASELVW